LISGASDAILNLIRSHRNYFQDEAHYLETGGYYSRASEAMYALKTEQFAKAMDHLDAMDITDDNDEFVDHVFRLVHFKYGFVAMENQDRSFLKYFKSTRELFIAVPSMEKAFSDLMLKVDGDQLFLYEKLLLYLYQQHSSDLLGKSLSLLISKSAIIRYNTRKINGKQLKIAFEKALKFDENNEMAQNNLEEICIELETEEVMSTLAKHKMNKAARLAADSAYDQVSEQFFDFISSLVDDSRMQTMDVEPDVRRIYLNDFLNAALIVDPTHPCVNKIQTEIDSI